MKRRYDDDEITGYRDKQNRCGDSRPKRLRIKESRSKKGDTEMRLGRVLEVLGNNRYLLDIDGEEYSVPLSGRFRNVDFGESRAIIVIGDYVRVNHIEEPIIEEIVKRKSVLKRFVQYRSRLIEVVIAANIDQVIITASVSEPELNLNLLDRYLSAVHLSEIVPIICINKYDLIEDKKRLLQELEYYIEGGIKVLLTSIFDEKSISKLKKELSDKESVFSGASGVGKSSLINKLEPGINLRTGEVSNYTAKGVHTTSSSKLIPWSFGGYLIDTPGIKTFGLSPSVKRELPRIFPRFDEWSELCRFNDCTHQSEDGCYVKKMLNEGTLPQNRYQSYINLYESL